jgi:predicted dehydrogenase
MAKFKKFENNSPDYVNLIYQNKSLFIELEATLCMWKHTFRCEIVGSKGSLSIDSLCKWGPSTFTVRDRKLPSGRPDEESVTLAQSDPTWAQEYNHFKELTTKPNNNLKKDMWICSTIQKLAAEANKLSL